MSHLNVKLQKIKKTINLSVCRLEALERICSGSQFNLISYELVLPFNKIGTPYKIIWLKSKNQVFVLVFVSFNEKTLNNFDVKMFVLKSRRSFCNRMCIKIIFHASHWLPTSNSVAELKFLTITWWKVVINDCSWTYSKETEKKHYFWYLQYKLKNFS